MALQSFTVSIGALRDVNNNDKNYVSGEAIYVKTIGGTFAPIFRDLAGTSEIAQDGLANQTNEKGQFTFFVEAGDYILEYQNQSTPVTIVGADYFNNRVEETVNQIIIDTSTSRGFRVVGDFASGFTYELPNDVAVDASGNYWAYADVNALPVTVSAGTTPTEGEYSQRTWNSASAVLTNTGESVQDFADSFALKIFQSPTDGGLTEIQTRTVNANEVYEVRKTSDDSLAAIYSDAAGTIEIVQNGNDNKSGSDGVIEFYIADGDYYVASGGSSVNFSCRSTNRITTTVSEIESGVFKVGSYLELTDRSGAKFNVVAGGTANGYDIINAGNGNVAIYFRDGAVRLEHLGASSNLINNAPAINAALAYGGDVQGDRGVVYPVTGNLKPRSNSTIRDIKVKVGGVWSDDTGNDSVLRRGVVNYSGLMNVDTYNFDVVDDFNSVTDLAITAFLITGCNNVHFYKCRADHTAARTRTYAPFDFEGGNTNCSWNKGYTKNETEELGGCWLRAVSGASSGLKVTDSEFDKKAGDEVIAVFGVLNKISDVEMCGNTFRSKSGKTQGTSISIFPLSAGPDAAVENVRFHDNTVIAAGFTDSAYRVGDSADVAYLCDNIQTYNNTFVITNALPTSDVIRFVDNVGSNVNFRDNSVIWGDAKHCRATISGNFKDVSGNTIRDYAINTFSSCDHVHDNIDCINSYQAGQVFLNVTTFVNNECEAGSAGQVFGSGMRSRVNGNTFRLNGTSYAFSYNGLNIDNPSFDIDNNDIETTDILGVCMQFDTNTISKSKLVGNRWKGIQAADYFTGRGNSFDVVKGNSWWSFTDEARSSIPFVKTSYTKMFPLGAFIHNDAIGSTTGLVTLGWSKQEANAVSADWKAVKVTI